MKEASSELSMTAITVVAIAACIKFIWNLNLMIGMFG